MPVVWNPGRVAALAALDLALALAPVGLLPLDGGQASAFASGESDGTDGGGAKFARFSREGPNRRQPEPPVRSS